MSLTMMAKSRVTQTTPASPVNHSSPVTQRAHLVAATALLLIVIASTFPVPIIPLKAGLDNSWKNATNVLADRGTVFGKDILFTYGPLAYAVNPIDLGSPAWAAKASIAHLCIYTAWWISLALVLFSKANFPCQMLIVLASLLKRESVEFLVPTVLGLLIVGQHRHRRITALAASVITATALLIKFNTGLECMVALFAWAVVVPNPGGARAIARRVAAIAIIFTTTVALEFLACGGGFADLLTWVRDSFAIAADYSSQMSSTAGPAWQIAMMLAGLAAVAAYGTLSLAIGWDSWRKTAIILVPLFMEYKHAITRHDDGHFQQGLMVSASIITLLLVGNQTRQERRLTWWLAATYLTAALAIWLDNPARITLAVAAAGYACFALARSRSQSQPGQTVEHTYQPLEQIVATITAAIMIIGLTQVTHPTFDHNKAAGPKMIAAYLNIDQYLAQNPEPDPNPTDILPPDIINEIGQQPVDVYPTDISLVLRNHLNWSPRYVLQSYQAYNPPLDLRSAAHYQNSTNPPQFVIYSKIWFDNYNQCVVDCATWNALYRWYDFVSQPLPDYLLLRRRETPRWTSEQNLGSTIIRFGERWEVPKNADASIILKASIKLSTAGKLMRGLFRVDPAAIKIEYEDGTETVNRTAWRNLESGFLVSDLPKELEGARSLFQGNTANKVKAITFLCNPRDYQPEIPIEWSQTQSSSRTGT